MRPACSLAADALQVNAIIDGDELPVPDDDGGQKDIAAQTSPSRRNLLGLWRQRRSVFPERQSGDSDRSGHDHASQLSLAAIEVWRRHGAATGEMDGSADSDPEPAGSDDEEEVRTVSVARTPVEGEDTGDETIGEHANDTEALQRRRNERRDDGFVMP